MTLPTPLPTLTKGHGTGNDFLLYTDADGTGELPPDTVAAIADRHTGFGADGVIRAVPTELVDPQAAAQGAHWFMDYRNADGSAAQMCGNGIRVFAAYLRQAGLVEIADGASILIATRAGVLTVRREGTEYAADMGTWRATGGPDALAAGFDVSVVTEGLDEQRPGLRLELPNPHTVVALQDEATLLELDLSTPPRVDPQPEHGTNVEFVVPLGDAEGEVPTGALRMRVHERGVGETLSCGTGACAAALAVRAWFGEGAPDHWQVQVPGGTLRVRVDGDRVELAGPAELVGVITPLGQ